MRPTDRWKQLLDERLREAVTVLGRVPGVHGFMVGGSMGRGEPWPMSDIDLLPIYTDSADQAAELDRRRADLVDWWAASGRAQTLDLGWLAFTAAEIRDAMGAGPEQVAARMTDRRWFHGLDKAYGGHAADPDDALAEANRIRPDDPAAATRLLRESARALRLVLIERWGERLGSMGREWTRFERMAHRHGRPSLAVRIATLAGADTPTAAQRARLAPPWLQERIDLSYAARTAIGEDVSPAENARDQLAAFTVHVARHRPDLDGPWTGSPDPDLDAHLAELHDLITHAGAHQFRH